MRYQQIDTIVFTDKNNKSYSIKDMREYPTYTHMTNLKTQADDMIDQIASRQEIYGTSAEHSVYRIYENNIENLFECYFDMSKIKILDIPTL